MIHGTCSYIRMYINAVADSVVLCLHNFITIFKVKYILYITSGSAPPLMKNSGWAPAAVTWIRIGNSAGTVWRRKIAFGLHKTEFSFDQLIDSFLYSDGLHSMEGRRYCRVVINSFRITSAYNIVSTSVHAFQLPFFLFLDDVVCINSSRTAQYLLRLPAGKPTSNQERNSPHDFPLCPVNLLQPPWYQVTFS